MPRVATIVFLDSEATGVPEEENNQCKITELSMIAVKRQHLLEAKKGETPRVQHKLTLCMNPRRQIRTVASTLSGLTNHILENESPFDHHVVATLKSFLTTLEKPVCLVAHFGSGFDYPVLKNHLIGVNESFPEDLLYTDSFNGFKCMFKALPSFKLTEVYKYIFKEAPLQSHRAEDDCMTLLKCAVAVSEHFILWVDHHSHPFTEIKPMRIGVSVKESRRFRL